ncbi:MAG: chlorite dismutase [Chloroflexota bacterium]|nr:MAG: chlorite dismutase [Chloroflexota bacterium]
MFAGGKFFLPEQTAPTLNHFSLFTFQERYYEQPKSERQAFHRDFLKGVREAAACVNLYQVYPALSGADLLLWSAIQIDSPQDPANFFTRFARATNPFRQWLAPNDCLWGFTRPSQYTKTRSNQEIDPFSSDRKAYLVMYPFVKTVEWYLMGRESRQGMMNEHIRIGKQYPEIKQLLLYSFGLQDQEFIVVYDTDDLAQFSDLVYELRDTEARRYTQRDTPLYTALYHPAEETLALWE